MAEKTGTARHGKSRAIITQRILHTNGNITVKSNQVLCIYKSRQIKEKHCAKQSIHDYLDNDYLDYINP